MVFQDQTQYGGSFMINVFRMMIPLFVFAFLANDALAKPTISTEKIFYEITGSTSSELKAQMKKKGPRGFWARAEWYVRWTDRCKVSVELTYTYPQWTNRKSASKKLQESWDYMMAALREHEEVHGQHGINAAEEIEASKCKGNPRIITNKWAQRDRDFDRETRHGTLEGVVLP